MCACIRRKSRLSASSVGPDARGELKEEDEQDRRETGESGGGGEEVPLPIGWARGDASMQLAEHRGP